jgi:hypothetical protein
MVPIPEFWWKSTVNQLLKAVIPTSPTKWDFLMMQNLIGGWHYWCNMPCTLRVIFVVLSSHKYNDSEEPLWRKFCICSQQWNKLLVSAPFKVIALLYCGIKHHYIQTVRLSEAALSKSITTADCQWLVLINFTVISTISNPL